MFITKSFFLSSLLLASLVMAKDDSEKDSKFANVVHTTDLSSSCQNKLIRIVDAFVGKKKHRILEHSVSNSDAFHAFILLSYNDQDSHLSYTAVPSANGNCQVNMNESFELPAPCPDARNSIFKRWEIIGRLDENTLVVRYDNPRRKEELLADENARAMGFLTQTRRGKSCLVTRQQQNMPLPPQKDKE